MKPFVCAFIFARGGSRGVPKKNIRELGGKPLIAYAIECALQSKLIGRVIVSTDCQEIAEVARQYGAEVPFMRPAELATDEAPEHLAWKHAIREIQRHSEYSDGDIFVSLPATAPFRSTEDVDACIERFIEGGGDTVIAVSESERHPWFNMVKMHPSGEVELLGNSDHRITRRQDAPKAYDVTTVAYVTSPAFVLQSTSYFDGIVVGFEVPRERSLDIDTMSDFEYAEFLLAKKFRSKEI